MAGPAVSGLAGDVHDTSSVDQIVGKVRLSQTPWLNHSWHVTLYVTARGLTTSPIPYGERTFQIDLDFIEHALRIETSDGPRWQMPLHAKSVEDFHAAVMAALSDVGIKVHIDEIPNELPDPIRFSEDRVHAAYDGEYAQRFWRVLLQADRVFKAFRTSFIDKCSPVHFFWGSFDLAVTRFSGRRAPRHPGGVPHVRMRLACRSPSNRPPRKQWTSPKQRVWFRLIVCPANHGCMRGDSRFAGSGQPIHDVRGLRSHTGLQHRKSRHQARFFC